MKVHCEGPDCQVEFEAPEGYLCYFCSIECACYAGQFSVTKGWLPKPTEIQTLPTSNPETTYL